MWFAEFQPEHHKAEYGKVGFEKKDNSLIVSTVRNMLLLYYTAKIFGGGYNS